MDAAPPAGPAIKTVKVQTYSASGTSETEQLADRLQDLEDKLEIIEATALGGDNGPAIDESALDEIRNSVEQLSATVQQVWTFLQELAQQSQDSLGFAAKQTFDCPECNSHGTIAVPVSCTHCGHEAEWGFWPEAPRSEDADAA